MQEQAISTGQSGASRFSSPRFTRFNQAASHPSAYPIPRYRTGGASRAGQLARALGWFSIGIGLAELLVPRTVARAAGVNDRPLLLRTLGARELASGVGILTRRQTAGWLWSRVAGDAMDLALLGIAAGSIRSRRGRVAAATAAVAGVALLDVLSSVQHSQQRGLVQDKQSGSEVQVDKCITINRSAEDCYRFWREFENLPRFMQHLESVQTTSDNRSHWKARAPAGTSVEWDAEVTADDPGRFIAWHSLEGADIDNAGIVHFERAPGGRGTVVRVELQYQPPGGGGTLVARLFGEEPSQQIDEDLRRFKQLLETGEIPTTIGQPAGRRSAISRLLFRKGTPG
jgi:uncharacterized membrane protein